MNVTETRLTCARHPKEETNLRCGKCDTLICPKCTVFTPVGARCPDCGHMKSGLFKPSIIQSLCAGVVGTVAGTIAGWLVGTMSLGIWSLFLAVPFGTAAAELILRAGGRKRGRLMETIAGGSFALGAIGGRMVIGVVVMSLQPEVERSFLTLLLEAFYPFPIGPLALAIALSCIVSRIRYL